LSFPKLGKQGLGQKIEILSIFFRGTKSTVGIPIANKKICGLGTLQIKEHNY